MAIFMSTLRPADWARSSALKSCLHHLPMKLAFLFGGGTMKKAERWIVLTFMVLASISSYSFAFAQDSESNRQSLRGIEGIFVLIESIKAETQKDGLTENLLRTDTELKLRLGRIKVLSGREFVGKGGQAPYLYVNPNVLKFGTNSAYSYYSYNVSIRLFQEVSLVRDPKIKLDAATWSINIVGFTNKIEDIRTQVKNAVDRFINAYLSVNPK